MSNNTYSNPWAGLSSYQDPESTDVQLKFCGRDNESYDVTQLIDDNIFVTLYGKSGTGKTSLLNAGVFPRLRQEQYLPVSIRLGMDAYNISFQQCVLAKIGQALQNKGTQTTVEVVPMPEDEHSTEYLWSYFARTRFTATDGSTLFPVLVFDQFEEVFRNRRVEVETLLRQIHFMMDENHALSDRMVDGQPYQYDFNFRFVASIREDDLYRLEDSIDNCYLPELKRCRYRLRSLSEQGASDVILIPGEGLFKADEQTAIVDKIVGMSKHKEDDSVSTNMLSLLCSRIFEMYRQSGDECVTLPLVNRFVSENPFERFYNEATNGFSNSEKSYMENHLVDSYGRRDSVPESEFMLHVKNGAILMGGQFKILQRISVSSDNQDARIELIHDSFCEPLMEQKTKRDRRRRSYAFFLLAGFTIAVCVGAYLIVNGMSIRQDKMLENQSRFVSEKAMTEVGNHDSYLARLLSLYVLPQNLKHPDRPFVLEAEAALRNASMQDDGILSGHGRLVNSVLFTPDGKLAVSSSRDSTVRVWDISTGQCRFVLRGHTDWVNEVCVSPDGRYISSASDDKTVRVWETESGKCRYVLKGHTDRVTKILFCSDGRRIVSVSRDKSIRVWDIKDKKCLHTLRGHEDVISSVSINNATNNLVSCSADNTARIWDLNEGKQLKTLTYKNGRLYDALYTIDGQKIITAWDEQIVIWDVKSESWQEPLSGHTDVIYKLLLSPDGKYVLSLSNDNTIRVWACDSGKCMRTLAGHTDIINCAVFFGQSNKVASGAYDNTVRIWNLDDGQCEVLSGHTANIQSLAVNCETCLVSASVDKTIRLWDMTSHGKILRGHDRTVDIVTYSPNGKLLVSAAADTTLRVWDALKGQCQQVLKGHSKGITSAVFTQDSKYVVTSSLDKTIRLWDVAKGICVRVLNGHGDYVSAVCLNAEGNRLFSWSNDKTIRVWELKTGKCLRVLKGHKDRINTVALNPDNSLLASASNDSTVRLWNVKSGKCIKVLKRHKDYVNFACFVNDGRNLCTLSYDDTLRVWNIENGSVVKQYHTGYVHKAVISPDRKSVAMLMRDNKTIWIWDASKNEITSTMTGHVDKISNVAFSPSGNNMVTSSKDNTIRAWDVATGLCVQTLDGHDSPVFSVCFSPDGQQIASASSDNTIRIWSYPPLQQLIDETRERFKNRPLTPEERLKYYLE